MEDISERMRRIVSFTNPFKYISAGENTYHPTRNPKGIISFALAQNRLCGDLMLEQVKKLDLSECDGAALLQYQDIRGMPAFRKAIADFLKDYTNSPQDIDPDKIRVCNGLTALTEVMAFILCDERDTILSPSPLYSGIVKDTGRRPNVNLHPIHLSSKPGAEGEEPYTLTVEHLERGYQEATQQGKRVRVLSLVNPLNPLGTVYTKPQIREYLQFAKRHNLHVLLDEIYLCSVYDQTKPFCSVLSLREDEIPDLNRTHFMWSFSKDFCFNASKCGVLYSWNEKVLEAATVLIDYHTVSSLIQITLTQILQNKEWLHNVYFKTCHERLREARDITMVTLDEMGVAYIKPTAGFYIWADFSKFLGASTHAEEKSLCCHLLSCGVMILVSAGFYGNEPGWFRVLFCNPKPELEEGLKRLKEGCLSYKPGTGSAIADDLAGDLANDLAGDLADVEILGASGESLESLVRSFKVSLQNSDWLKENTSDMWRNENPEVSETWIKELEKNPPE
ncbi:probable inactive 1-aminocyclopropane-1-carboxylate synthase-like protein 2 [Strongylocentrotus purpuratus]|uniref:Aminotransferase class I/classII large domain-containing protein n=1 Tax=Strongylocentrotus purpuratus TaxID=7668 RepID=A0A7M7T0H5_STRPU|nr:probable inactive 1-aminocyclopropane-1-carboxylate synthase-like protein 2 [Strongylocentrotus purpuratus]